MQGHLAMGCAGQGPHPVPSLLGVVEALRLWRACAAHGVVAFVFEDMHALLCGLMEPPQAVAAAEEGAAAAAASVSVATSSGRDEGEGEVQSLLQWHLAREVALLLDRLLVHAVRDVSEGGEGPPGRRSMLQPGTAAAVAADMARLWLAPGVVRVVGAALVARPEGMLRVPGAAQWMEWWVGAGFQGAVGGG